jgi:hypothetical protein
MPYFCLCFFHSFFLSSFLPSFLPSLPTFFLSLFIPIFPFFFPAIFYVFLSLFIIDINFLDFALRGHILASFSVQSPIDCMRKCIEESICQSFNCEHVTKPTLQCELNYETKLTKPVFYVKRTGFTYHDALGPGSGWCNSVCSSPYKTVICPKGFAGMDCQIPSKYGIVH